MKKAAILAAGNGERIRSISPFKPIVKINGMPLLELTIKNLNLLNFKTVAIIFNEQEKVMDLSELPSLTYPHVNFFFKSTPGSLHSLYEVSQKLAPKIGEHLFVSMVDSVVVPSEAVKFHQFCLSLKQDESAILATSYIEDEKPLTLEVDSEGYVKIFQCPLCEGVLITSGVYYFSAKALLLLSSMIDEGHVKMRTFLAELVKRNHKIKVYESPKTLDIDRPEDIRSAEIFLKENT